MFIYKQTMSISKLSLALFAIVLVLSLERPKSFAVSPQSVLVVVISCLSRFLRLANIFHLQHLVDVCWVLDVDFTAGRCSSDRLRILDVVSPVLRNSLLHFLRLLTDTLFVVVHES